MDARDFRYEDLGEYSCRDQRTNNELILNITDSKCMHAESNVFTHAVCYTLMLYYATLHSYIDQFH